MNGSEPGGTIPQAGPRVGRARRVWQRALAPRGWRLELPLAMLAAVLGLGLALSVRTQQGPTGLATARQDDLVRILADLGARNQALQQQILQLQDTAQQLQDSAGGGVALEQARQRAADLGILAGTVAAHGPGLTVEIVDPGRAVNADVLLDAVEELRGAGAEALDISGVRVVTSTSLQDVPDGISVDGTVLRPPYLLTAIGEPPTMQKALEIPGGVTDAVSAVGNGAGTRIRQQPEVAITSLRAVATPRYARPAPSPSGAG